MDIVDVWFESGSTHAFVLEGRHLPWPADLYLEGSDQHRGWFQSSLLESVGTRGVAPFKAVLTDGFVIDEHGRKMSKSLGNVVAPEEVADKYGVDILRLWVMMSDTTEDLRIGPEILKQQAELYRRLRNTLRWVLGSLAGFTDGGSGAGRRHAGTGTLRAAPADRAGRENPRRGGKLRLDRGVSRAAQFLRHRSVGVLFRHPQGRDLLRPAGQPAPPRRAHRAGPSASLPVHLAGAGAVLHRRGSLDRPLRRTGQRAPASVPDLPHDWRDDRLAAKWEQIRAIRRRITVPMEEARRANVIGASLQAAVTLKLAPDEAELLNAAGWAELAIVSGCPHGRRRGR